MTQRVNIGTEWLRRALQAPKSWESLPSLHPSFPGRRGPAQPRTAESSGGAAPSGPPGGGGAAAPGSTGRAAAGARAAAARAAASGALRAPAGANVGAAARGERPAGGFGVQCHVQPRAASGTALEVCISEALTVCQESPLT